MFGAAISWVFGIVARYPWQCALIAALLACGWLWQGKQHALADRNAWKLAHAAQVKAYEAAQAAASAKAIAAKLTAEAAYKRKADEADASHAAALDGARSTADRYIAAHRLRPEGACRPSGGTIAAAQSDGAGVSAIPSANALVAVSEGDIRACTDAAIYARSAYEWARGLN